MDDTTHNLRQGWKLHSGRLTPISTEFWLSSEFNYTTQSLSNREGEYVDIVLSQFFIMVLWPQHKEDSLLTPTTLKDMAVLTPYLSVLKKLFLISGRMAKLQ